jgi:hypothetical protein
MAARWGKFQTHSSQKNLTSQGHGGRGRSTRIATATMNKSKKRSHKKYRGQGR